VRRSDGGWVIENPIFSQFSMGEMDLGVKRKVTKRYWGTKKEPLYGGLSSWAVWM
jgi:hypothetical protein